VSCEAFFTDHGWRIREIRYLGEESQRLGRPVPLPLFAKMKTCSCRKRNGSRCFGTWATRSSNEPGEEWIGSTRQGRSMCSNETLIATRRGPE
jgi:hypothetical protein